MREVDGHINRALEGKTVVGVTKDGTFMTVHCTNGERWGIGWADFTKGVGFPGEPAIVSIGELRDASANVEPLDGGVSRLLAGKTIESARTDGEVLYLQCSGGRRYGIAWIDPGTKQRIKAEPCLTKVDATIRIQGVSAESGAGM